MWVVSQKCQKPFGLFCVIQAMMIIFVAKLILHMFFQRGPSRNQTQDSNQDNVNQLKINILMKNHKLFIKHCRTRTEDKINGKKIE